jgi:hypothetical protein
MEHVLVSMCSSFPFPISPFTAAFLSKDLVSLFLEQMTERTKLWAEFQSIARDTSYNVKDAIKSMLTEFSSLRRKQLFLLRQLALYEWVVCASVSPPSALKWPVLYAPAQVPRFKPPDVGQVPDIASRFPSGEAFSHFYHWKASRDPKHRLRFQAKHLEGIRSLLATPFFATTSST